VVEGDVAAKPVRARSRRNSDELGQHGAYSVQSEGRRAPTTHRPRFKSRTSMDARATPGVFF
jgi:hypothetical protein